MEINKCFGSDGHRDNLHWNELVVGDVGKNNGVWLGYMAELVCWIERDK